MEPVFLGTGLPWYRREDYPRIRQIMADEQDLPRSYDEWQELAEERESEVIWRGGRPVRVVLDPQKFSAWCLLRGLRIDSSARLQFAGDPANWPNKH